LPRLRKSQKNEQLNIWLVQIKYSKSTKSIEKKKLIKCSSTKPEELFFNYYYLINQPPPLHFGYYYYYYTIVFDCHQSHRVVSNSLNPIQFQHTKTKKIRKIIEKN